MPVVLALVALGTLSAGTLSTAGTPSTKGLTAAAVLARAYDTILDARFDEVPDVLRATCPPGPAEACQLLDAVALWWRIQLDPGDQSRDALFASRVEAAIAAATTWTTRDPQRAEAWFYLGVAYGARSQWRVLRGERLAAARDGKRIKDALERALTLDPTMADAYFGLGLYHYYADVAPRILRVLRWLLLLPGGNRVAGLDEMLRARQAGQIVRSEADYQLHIIYLWYERQPARAVELLEELRARYPHNPHFHQTIAEIQDFYIDDTAASLRMWKELFEAAQDGKVAEPAMAETSARLGIALQLDQLSRGEEGLAHLRHVIAAHPAAPVGAVPRAHLQMGDILVRLGRRAEAADAYRAAIKSAGSHDPLRVAARARAALRAATR